MNNQSVLEFIRVIDSFDDKSYLLSMVAYSAAPTVDGHKPSTLITFTRNQRNLYGLWQQHKEEVVKSLDISFFELRKTEDSILILIYRPEVLKEYLFKEDNIRFLNDYGYTEKMNIEACIERLKSKFCFGCPHEMGVFLGYPVKDVMGFIANQGKECLMCKYWKVYHNPRRARYIFDIYDKAKDKMANAILKAFYSKETMTLCSTIVQ